MLDHVEIYVNHLKEARTFYEVLLEKLGWHLYQEWSHGFSYRFDHYYLVFVETEPSYQDYVYHRKHSGLNHLAFQVKTEAEVDQFRTWVMDNNLSELYSDKYPHASGRGYYALYFEGPERVKIEIVVRQ